MDLKKTWFTMLIFLLVSVLIWLGFSVYFNVATVNINPNASSYTTVIQPQFDTDVLKKVGERLETLPVSPNTFLQLVTESNN